MVDTTSRLFFPGKEPRVTVQEAGWITGAGLDKNKKESAVSRSFEPRTVKPAASHSTDYNIPFSLKANLK